MNNKDNPSIVIVEDDPGHARLIEKNLQRSEIDASLLRFENGQELVDYLFCRGVYAGHGVPSPSAVLLDLNMPVLDGYQVLERIKSDPRTQRIPVIVLSTTDNHHDIEQCYALGCNIYITKPVDYQLFSSTIQRLGNFLNVIAFPYGQIWPRFRPG